MITDGPRPFDSLSSITRSRLGFHLIHGKETATLLHTLFLGGMPQEDFLSGKLWLRNVNYIGIVYIDVLHQTPKVLITSNY